MLLTAYLNLPLVKFRRMAQNRAAHESKRYLFAEMTPPDMLLYHVLYQGATHSWPVCVTCLSHVGHMRECTDEMPR